MGLSFFTTTTLGYGHYNKTLGYSHQGVSLYSRFYFRLNLKLNEDKGPKKLTKLGWREQTRHARKEDTNIALTFHPLFRTPSPGLGP